MSLSLAFRWYHGLVLLSVFLAWVVAGIVALAAIRAGALTPDGAFAASIVGALILAAGGVRWAAIILVFFVSSSALSRLPASRPHTGIAEKGDRRDAAQVLANGGMAAMCALGTLFVASPVWFAGFAASLAAATADTWATEIGMRSRQRPISLRTGRPVPPGTSGAVTPLGLAGALAGATLIGVSSLVVGNGDAYSGLVVLACGMGGSLADSVIGATIQESRYCPFCNQLTEQIVHRACVTPTRIVRGWQGMNNDAVNFAASSLSALVALALVTLR